MSDFVNKQNARPGVYEDAINRIAKENVCPFCPEHLAEFHKRPMEHRKYWIATENMYPYTPSKEHLMFIHIEHIRHIGEISPEAWSELGELVREQTAKRNMTGGTLYLRFGDPQFTGSSVTHLHANIVQSDPDDATYDPKKGLWTRIG